MVEMLDLYIRFDFIQNIWNNNNSQPYGVVNIKAIFHFSRTVPKRTGEHA
jgi:hypothetical protein